MEPSKERKQEIVDILVSNGNTALNYSTYISNDFFLNKEEEDWTKEKLARHFYLHQDRNTLKMGNLEEDLKNIKNHPKLRQEIKATVRKNVPFINRNSQFLVLGSIVISPVLIAVFDLLNPIIGGGAIAACSVSFLLGIKEIIKKTAVEMSDKMKAELRGVLNYEFGLSENN